MSADSLFLSRIIPWERPREHCCVLLGAGYSGKTTLLYKLKCGEVMTTMPTIGFNCETVEYDEKAITFWDFGGCDKIAPLARHLLTSETGVLFLVDVTTEEGWYRDFSFELLELHTGQLVDAGGQYFWVALAKQDLLPPETRDETVRRLKGEYESRLKFFSPQLKWKVLSQPGLSLLEDQFVWPIFDEIHASLEQQQKQRSGKEKKVAVPTVEMPTDKQLRARIRSEGLSDISAGEFWKHLTVAQLPAWDHRSHLRAGYMIYLDVLSKMGSFWTAVEEFLKQLEHLRSENPQRFTNTQHRTITIFWLHQIRLAILRYRDEVNNGVLPSAEDFQNFLLSSPTLMNGRIWQYHYSKSLLFSPEAKEHWVLPDLAPLPDYTPKPTNPSRQVAPAETKADNNKFRLPRFGFAVVQEYLTTTNQRRGAIIKGALNAQLASTLRLRATIDPEISPYSETQSYFWIQITHAAVAGMPSQNMEKNRSLTNLTFETFSLLFPELADDKLWTKYYTVKVWNSVGARMAFTNPDIKPLPNVIGIASTQSIAKASSKLLDEEVKVRQPLYADDDEVGEADWVVVEKDVSEKSREYIELRRALILGDVKEITQFNEANNAGGGSLPTAKILEPTTHARLLYTLFVIFSANSVTPSAAASEAFSVLTGPKILGLTQTAFWIRIFTAAFMQMRRDGHASVNKDVGFDLAFFTDLLVQHPQLMFEDLWTKYYSREVWESYDAKVGLVEMDRGKLEGFLGPWARRDVK